MKPEKRSIVLIHGQWMTPRIWRRFRDRYELQGHKVLIPAWPRLCGEVEEIRRSPEVMNGLDIREIVDHYIKFVQSLETPPILMGHSLGGLIVQILLDRGLGRAGVAIGSIPPQGTLHLPLQSMRSSGVALLNPLNTVRTVGLTLKRFRSLFANRLTAANGTEAYQEQIIPTPGRVICEIAFANLNPWSATQVHFPNPRRAPLLFISGEQDNMVPTSLVQTAHAKYRNSPVVTELKVFPDRCHMMIVQEGWEEIADFALGWTLRQPSGNGWLSKAISADTSQQLQQKCQ